MKNGFMKQCNVFPHADYRNTGLSKNCYTRLDCIMKLQLNAITSVYLFIDATHQGQSRRLTSFGGPIVDIQQQTKHKTLIYLSFASSDYQLIRLCSGIIAGYSIFRITTIVVTLFVYLRLLWRSVIRMQGRG